MASRWLPLEAAHREQPVFDRVGVQIVRGLLIAPACQHRVEHLFLGMKQGSAARHEQRRRTARDLP
jgi:hypothetical protein